MKQQLSGIEQWLSKTFHIDAKYFAKGTVWLMGSNIALTLISFFTIWMLANFLSKADFGFYQFFLALLGIVAITALPGTRPALTVAVSQQHDGTFNKLIKQRLIWSLVGSLGFAITALYFFIRKGEYWELLLLAAILFPLLEGFKLYNDYFNARKNFKRSALQQIGAKLVTWVPITLVFFVFTKNIYIVIILFIILQVLFHTWGYFEAKKELGNTKIDKEATKYGWIMTFNHGLNIFANQIDKVIVTYFFGLANLASYAIIRQMGDQFKSFSGVFKTMIFPRLSEMSPQKSHKTIVRKWAPILLINVGLALAAIIIVHPVITYLFPTYVEIIPHTQLLIAFLSTAYVSTLITTYFMAHKGSGVITAYTLSYNTVKILGFLILIPTMSLWGGVYAIMIAEVWKIVYMVGSFVLLGKRYL